MLKMTFHWHSLYDLVVLEPPYELIVRLFSTYFLLVRGICDGLSVRLYYMSLLDDETLLRTQASSAVKMAWRSNFRVRIAANLCIVSYTELINEWSQRWLITGGLVVEILSWSLDAVVEGRFQFLMALPYPIYSCPLLPGSRLSMTWLDI